MNDTILMEGMAFHNHTGVLDSEKKHGQTFVVDVELELPPIRACETDSLTDTISYSDAYAIIRDIMELEAFDLVERLCGVIAERLLRSFDRLTGVQVTVRKPNAPIDGAFSAMGVRIRRTRAGLTPVPAGEGCQPTVQDPCGMP